MGYLGWIRPWHLRWGATEEEVHAAMPGEELLPHPMLCATRAVTIGATPEQVWPWIVQMGYGRGGFYAIDIIDNNAQPSADHLIPALQNLKVGDTMPTSPLGGFTIDSIDPPVSMVMTFTADALPGVGMSGVTAMRLIRTPARSTRLICRLQADFDSTIASRLYYLLFEPGDFLMMRQMMLGIRDRAERTTDTDVAAIEHPLP